MIKIRRLEMRQSVSEALQDAQKSLLPERFRDHRTTRWLLSFNARRGLSFRESVYGGPAEKLIREIGRTFVQPKMQYYHAVLMELGTRWARAEESLNLAHSALAPDNLARTLQFSGVDGQEVEQVARRSIREWSSMLNMIDHTWEVWRNEVDELQTASERASVDAESVPYLSELLGTVMRRSELHERGFPDNRDVSIGPVLGTLALAGLASMASKSSGWYGSYYSGAEVLERAVRAFEFSQTRPESDVDSTSAFIADWHRALEAEYPDGSPFEAYLSVERPADKHLGRLVAGNTIHFGAKSRWLREFEAVLPEFDTEALPWRLDTSDEAFGERVTWGLVTADAVIKSAVIENENFTSDRARYDFATGWVEPLADHYLTPNNNMSGPETYAWFVKFVRAVVLELQKFGTDLSSPSDECFRALKVSVDNHDVRHLWYKFW